MRKLLFITLLIFPLTVFTQEIEKRSKACLVSREFITSYRYFNNNENLQMSIVDKVKTAKQIASYCDGAADRFVKVADILLKAGVTPPDALEMALKKASENDATVEGFITIFRESFLEKYLDMDLANSLKLADSVTSLKDVDGHTIELYFKSLFEFCHTETYLNLNKPLCAKFVSETLPLASLYRRIDIAKIFQRLTKYFSKHSELIANKQKALDFVKEIISYGPGSVDNFITAYDYVSQKNSELPLPYNKAIKFTLDLVELGRVKNSSVD